MQNELVIKYDTRTPSGEDTVPVASAAHVADVLPGFSAIVAALGADENVDSDSVWFDIKIGGSRQAFT